MTANKKIFAVRDLTVGAITTVFVAATEVEAIRSIVQAGRNPETNLAHFPKEFQLELLAEITDIGHVNNFLSELLTTDIKVIGTVYDLVSGLNKGEEFKPLGQ